MLLPAALSDPLPRLNTALRVLRSWRRHSQPKNRCVREGHVPALALQTKLQTKRICPGHLCSCAHTRPWGKTFRRSVDRGGSNEGMGARVTRSINDCRSDGTGGFDGRTLGRATNPTVERTAGPTIAGVAGRSDCGTRWSDRAGLSGDERAVARPLDGRRIGRCKSISDRRTGRR